MKKSTFFKDFKAFISKGNILDMAVGVIIGGAFSPIVSSLVNDIIMPPLGLLFGTESLADMKWTIKEAVVEAGETVSEAVTINYGTFIATILNFILIALVIFTFLRIIMKAKAKAEALKKKEEAKPEEPAAPAEPSVEEKTLAVLGEIKELLEKK